MNKITHPPTYNPRVIFRNTYHCNLRCKMCYWGDPSTQKELEADPRTMSEDLYLRGLSDVEKYTDKIGLTDAGEFMSEKGWEKKMSKIVDLCAANPNLTFHQITNASLLTRKNIQKLRGIKKVTLLLSIDGNDPISYASIRKRGTLHKTLSNIRNLRKNLSEIGVTSASLQLSMTVMKRNVFTIPSMIELAKEIDAFLFVDHVQNFNQEFDKSESLYNFPVFSNYFLQQCRELADAYGVKILFPAPFAISEEDIKRYYEIETSPSRSRSCVSLDDWGPVSVMANGDVNVCCGDLVFGNLHVNTFEEIFNSRQFDVVRDSIKSGKPIGKCATCRWLLNGNEFLYECHQFDIPPETRCYERFPDLKKFGFFDYLKEFDLKTLTGIIENYQSYYQKHVVYEKIARDISNAKVETELRKVTLSLIKSQERIVIYPAGDIAKRFAESEYFEFLNVIAFADKNEQKHGERIKEKKIINPVQIKAYKPDKIIVAASKSLTDELTAYLAAVDCNDIPKIIFTAEG